MTRFAICLLGGLCLAQTRIDLSRQSTSPDLSAMRHTRPAQVGTALPATCLVGELFFKTSEPSGRNLYGCVSINLWLLMAPGTDAGPGAAEPLVTRTSDTVVTAGTAGRELVFRCGERSTSLSAAGTITLGPGSAAPASTVWLYFDCQNHGYKVDTSSAINHENLSLVNIDQGNTNANGFPPASIPIAALTAGNDAGDQWDATTLTDWRAAAGSTWALRSGSNLIDTQNADGSHTIGYDPTTGLQPTGAFDASGASQFRIRNVSADPAVCSVGEKIFNTATGTEKTCTAVNSWSVVGSGSGGTGAAVTAASPYLVIGSTSYLAPSMFAVSPPDTRTWTQLNGAGMVTTTSNHAIAIKVPNNNGVAIRGLTTPKAAAPATLTVAVDIQIENPSNVPQNVSPTCGVGYTDGTGVYGVFVRTGQYDPDVELIAGGWAALNGSTFAGYRSAAAGTLGRVFIRIANTSGNSYTFSWSIDGLTWTDISRTAEWNITPDRWFAGCTNHQGITTDSGPVSITLLHTDIS